MTEPLTTPSGPVWVLMTDERVNVRPVSVLDLFIQDLLDEGFSQTEIVGLMVYIRRFLEAVAK